ncbi:inward rectifier potassium channel Irk [Cytophagales bacterium WSM2-2]|nr:inward rectifier potassium channel Irk [Cytophagales bacterium WSM2-2]
MKKVYRTTIAKDGTTGAKRIGVNWLSISEIYHAMVTMRWPKFFLMLLIPFFLLTFFFTLLNAITGFEHFHGLTSTQSIGKFWEIFLFNAQTLTTVGGAGITPVGFTNNVILTIESMFAMLGAAVITGLLYVRFSRPSSGIIYSEKALISPYRGGKALMFRIANKKKNEVVELHTALFTIINDLATNKRDAKILKVERDYLPFLAHSFTVVHPLTEESPLFNFDWSDNDKTQYEIGVWFNAIDRVTGQNVFSGHTYFMHDIIHGAKFTSCMEVDENGLFLIHLDKVGNYEMI